MRDKEKEKGEMKKVKGWWFTTTERKLLNGDGRKIKLGTTHKVKGEIIPCQYGLHLSPRIIDALNYAPGPVIYKVEGSGVIIPHGKPVDKYACSHRTYLDGGINISDVLRKFARLCALDIIHLWNAPDVVVKYLKTGDENLRVAAREVAWEAARATAWDAARATASDAVRAAAREVAWEAAREAARAAARAAARDAAAWDAVRMATRDATREKQNLRLMRMVNHRLRKERRKEDERCWRSTGDVNSSFKCCY